MLSSKCPGQDTRYWTAEDIHEEPCPHCGALIEFWKTDIRVRCPQCKQKVANPRFNLGCAEWCAYAEQCLGAAARGTAPLPLRQVLEQELSRLLPGLPLQQKKLKEKLVAAEEKCREGKVDPLPVLIALVVLRAGELGRLNDSELFLNKLIEEHHFPVEAVSKAGTILQQWHGQTFEDEEGQLLAEFVE